MPAEWMTDILYHPLLQFFDHVLILRYSNCTTFVSTVLHLNCYFLMGLLLKVIWQNCHTFSDASMLILMNPKPFFKYVHPECWFTLESVNVSTIYLIFFLKNKEKNLWLWTNLSFKQNQVKIITSKNVQIIATITPWHEFSLKTSGTGHLGIAFVQSSSH